VGGKDSDDCAAKLFHTHVEENYFPGIEYDNRAVNGAQTADVPADQLPLVPTGMSGHVLVLIYIGGNDLTPYIFSSDEDAVNGYNADKPAIDAAWEEIFAFFADEGKFPDGATILMNTQYNPFDDCDAAPYNVSEVKTGLLHMYNDSLTEKANAASNRAIADVHPTFLGHGHHYEVEACPHYIPDAEYFMVGGFDIIHANAAGNHHIADIEIELADELWGSCG
jgi:hypothetical protein